mgnify:CR=1 FL=1
MLEIVEDQIAELKKLWKNKRLLLHQGLNLAMIVFSALMIWKGLMFLTKSESPVVVVLSGKKLGFMAANGAWVVLGNLVSAVVQFALLLIVRYDSAKQALGASAEVVRHALNLRHADTMRNTSNADDKALIWATREEALKLAERENLVLAPGVGERLCARVHGAPLVAV